MEIIEEKRKPGVMIEERKNIQFHIVHVEGLPQVGWLPRAGTVVSVESIGARTSASTETRKISSGPTVWAENMRILNLTDTSEIRFEARHHNMWNKRPSVLGRTDVFSVKQLLEMQREAGETLDATIDLVLTLNSSRAEPSPRTPKTPATPRGQNHSRSPSSASFLSVPNTPATPGTPRTPTTPTTNKLSNKTAVLRLSIRETAVADRNTRATASLLDAFAEQSRKECLRELLDTMGTMAILREAFEEGNNYVYLIDIVLGTLEGVRKLFANQNTKNPNRNTVATMQALNAAFVPYKSLSRKRQGKRGESSTVLMQDMLFSVVKALGMVTAFLSESQDAYVKDKLEFKVLAWMRYFSSCALYLNGKPIDRPEQPNVKSSKRLPCPTIMGANPELPKHNMLPMRIPEGYTSEALDRPDLMRFVAEWAFSSSYQSPPAQSTFRFPSVSHKRRPTNLNLDDPQSPLTDARNNSGMRTSLTNVFCLSGPAQSGKTELAVRMCEWFSELGCLGGYFTFDRKQQVATESRETPRQLLDSLPLTIIHQACNVEPELTVFLRNTLTTRANAIHDTLEKRFEVLFLEPLKEFINGRPGAAWSPLKPLLFIIDAAGVSYSEGKVVDEEAAQTGQMFLEWISSMAVKSLPNHIKFFVTTRPETGLDQLLKARGASMYEMGNSLGNLEDSGYGSMIGGGDAEVNKSSEGDRILYEGGDGVTGRPGSSGLSPSITVSIQSF